MPWSREKDEDDSMVHRRRFVCVVCHLILLRWEQVVEAKDGRIYCTEHAPEDEDASNLES